MGAAASKVVGWHSGDGPAANPYPAPSIEGALPLPKILAGAWSPNIVFNPHPHKRVVRTKEGQEVTVFLTLEYIVLLAPLSICG